ncbi:MAG: pitrilysin family protein [Isosphaeraceae bacterium]|nr:pitrilysin family protein [Isosphaeraceae bacterium]
MKISARFTPLVLVFALAATAPLALGAGREPQIPVLKVEKYKLANGLEVILHQDRSTPVVGVNIWYKVGSKDEVVGRTGFAHLFEHLMFQGSEHHDKEYFGPIEKVGAQINGSTNTDRTNYYETLPANALELALWLESDRMGFLLPALTQAKLDNQREVVKNERRQRVDNVPYGQSSEKLLEALYPPTHPYHHSVIGSMADLSAASLDDVSAFFRKYYAPNNASLVIAGDIDIPATKQLVEKYFGSLPAGEPVARPKPVDAPLTESKHVRMTDRVALDRVQLVWPSVHRGHPDEPALDILAAVLGQLDKENRLYRPLMYDKQLAANASAFNSASDLAGTFAVIATARPGVSLDELVAIADAEIRRLQTDGPTESEVAKAQTSQETQLIVGLQSATRKADFLNAYNVQFGDPLAFGNELKALFAVTPADVARVAKKYLSGNRVRLDVTKGPASPRAPEVATAPQEPTSKPAERAPIRDDFDRRVQPPLGPTPRFSPPAIVRRKLSNGLDVLIAERHELPILTLNLVVKAGDALAPADKVGLAPMTADLLTEGTKTRNAIQLAGELSDIGASLNAGSGDESANVSLTTLTKHVDKGLELFSDIVLAPSFPESELERLRKQKLSALLRRTDSAGGIAGVVFPKLLYSTEHPYGRSDSAKTLSAITRDDVVDFYRKVYVPNNAALTVVGDTTPDEITAKLEKALGSWKPGETPKVELPTPATAKTSTIYLVDKPGAAQSVLSVGKVGVARSTPDYFPLMVMNSTFGGQFSSRINLNLREDKGYTYGAQSRFDFRQGPGPFQASTSVQTAVTKPALAELMKEITDIAGPRPVTSQELEFAKDRIIKGFPSRFETTFGVAGTLADLVIFGLPDDFFTTYQSKVEAVSLDEVARVASKYLDPESMVILVVGDKSKIEAELGSLPNAGSGVTLLDAEGNPLPKTAPSTTGARAID